MSEPLSSGQYLRTKRQAAVYLGISLGTLERLTRHGSLPFIKITSGSAGAVRFHIDDLAAFVTARRVQRSGDAV
jgi:excisionase family DNA binding protein